MKSLTSMIAAVALSFCAAFPGVAQQAELDDLFAALKTADAQTAEPIAQKIWDEWSKSGSPAMDLLLARGREMIEQGDVVLAIQHFSALIDHAPDFAEAYNARATALYQMNRFGESLADVQMALALNPRHFAALSGFGTLLEELGYNAQALQAWRAVAEIYPASPSAAKAIARLTVIAEGVEL
ncbi:tetratricopeptide repeat protein [Oceaniglobus ichthyenteri]|uniref:tetratricopeptide repeat protein n=1 Tax=Oceaniglobus ichthyenteri TaxID=2136177 RepID=UPI001F0C046E|nr:tetratricopeptide repeat protein [Oceaniglobus ichthyenteri]